MFLARAFALAVVLVAAGCGGGEGTQGAGSQGASLFNEVGCAGCHTLTAAGARARVGPDLDVAAATYAEVAEQVRNGGSGMPAFADRLSDEEIAALATFVSSAASGTDNPSASTAAEFKLDETRLRDCKGSFSCLEQAFGNLAYEKGPKLALTEFDRRIAANPQIEANCHRIAHKIGAGALVHFEGEVGKAFAAGSGSCWSGYYHGILERAFAGVDASELAPVSRRLCDDEDVRRTEFIAYQCVHGLGHGLMIYTGYHLPKSLAICDRQVTEWDQTACASGVFMENISSSYGITSAWLRDDDPLYPCPTVAERHKLFCYLMVTSRILDVENYDFAKTADWCRRAEEGWVATCYQSLGRDASGSTRGDAARIVEICARGGDMARECVYGAARDLTAQDSGPGRSSTLCEKASQELRGYCYEGIGTILGDMFATEAERRTACDGASPRPAARAACRRGAGLT